MVLLGVVMDAKFKMFFNKGGNFGLEIVPEDYPQSFSKIVKANDYKVKAQLWIIVSGRADIRNVMMEEGEMRKVKAGRPLGERWNEEEKVLQGYATLDFGIGRDFSIEFLPRKFPPQFFRLVKHKTYSISGRMQFRKKGGKIEKVFVQGKWKWLKENEVYGE